MPMDMYQHDSSKKFRFVLKGELGETGAQQLSWAWKTAKSILNGKELIVEVSEIRSAHPAALEVLSRMRDAGARIHAARPPECEGLLRFLDLLQTPLLRSGKKPT